MILLVTKCGGTDVEGSCSRETYDAIAACEVHGEICGKRARKCSYPPPILFVIS